MRPAGLSLLLCACLFTAVLAVPRLFASTGQLAYQANQHGNWDLFLLDVRTGLTRPLTLHTAEDHTPSWSPDGRQVAFYSLREADGGADVYVLDADTGQSRRLTHLGRNWRPSWSPDGTRMALMGGFDTIYLMNADGSSAAELATGFSPSWSPDGQRIVYYNNQRDSLNSDIYTIHADGSGLSNLSQHPANDWDPVWSPDGTRIAFTSARTGSAEIYTMRVCAAGEVACTPDVQQLTFHPATDRTPAWSSDGRYIAYESERDKFAQIYIVEAACGGTPQTCIPRRLTWGRYHHRFPAWRP